MNMMKSYATSKGYKSTTFEQGGHSIMKTQCSTGAKKLKDRKLQFCFPAITPHSPRRGKEEAVTDTEELGKKVLKLCKVLRTKSPKLEELGSLKKGQGKLMSGFGMTNREIYGKVFGL